MADTTPYTPKYESTESLRARGDYILGATDVYGLHRSDLSQITVVSRFISQVKWNHSQLYAGKNNSKWLALLGIVHRLEEHIRWDNLKHE
jgi:hypothetical protein